MASVTQMALIFFTGALCLLSLPRVSHSTPQFIVEGEVYCEVCRTNFINRLSEPMAGATVKLQCKVEDTNNITYALEGKTDAGGKYRLMVEGDHGTEECEITLEKSTRDDCNEIPHEGWAIQPTSRITITQNSGFHDQTRKANPLGFTKKTVAPECASLFKELEINPNQDDF